MGHSIHYSESIATFQVTLMLFGQICYSMYPTKKLFLTTYPQIEITFSKVITANFSCFVYVYKKSKYKLSKKNTQSKNMPNHLSINI